MSKNKIIPFVVALALLAAVIGFGAQLNIPLTGNKNNNGDTQSKIASDDSVDVVKITGDSKEMRAVWVSFLTLDMSGTDRSETAFQKKFDEIIKVSKNSGFNTLIVQVRPYSDALYKSKYYPTSHIITGTQGEKMTYDPLAYMCKAAHDNDMEIHAWVNPYRVTSKNLSTDLSKDNPYVQDNSLGVTWKEEIYLNPALKEVRTLIINGVKEIVENYDVDGIQFDDYFYPTQEESFDKTQYNAYKKSMANNASILSLNDWRFANVNTLIADTYRAVHNIKSNVVFGISPAGNLDNNKELYADIAQWCKTPGYIDYICPQIYFSLDNPALSYENSLNSWLKLERHADLQIYVGLAGYKAGSDSDEGTWLDNDDILLQQIEILREKKVPGFMLYSYEALVSKESKAEIENVVNLLT